MDKLKAIWARFLSLKTWQKLVVVFLLFALVSAPFNNGSSTDSETANESTSTNDPNVGDSYERSYPISIETRAVVNPATISFRYRVTNDGTQPATPECTIRFQDPSGTYRGYDIFTPLEPIPAGVSQAFVGQLTITKEGAEFATEYEAECSARTTDVGSSAGKSVKISDIQNFSATDGSEGWYWMAQFKVDQPPMTQMDCVVKALDKSGKVVAETAYRANTLNNGAVVAFGENESTKSVVDASKALVQSIKSFDVKCTL
jgi:hypothetical protein